MRTKRFAAGVLAACLSLALALPCAAAESAAALGDAAQVVSSLGILSNEGNLSQKVTRAEFVAMAVKASPGGDAVGEAAVAPYPDVPKSHWASGYVEAAVNQGLVTAYSDGTFRPNQEIKLAEAASIALSLLGYGPEDFSGAYPSGQMALYRRLKLGSGVSAAKAASAITRQDATYLFYNLLSARTKEGAPYIQSLGYSLDASGKPDIVSLANGEMEGPIVAQKGWSATLGFTPSAVYRNNSPAALGAVQNYDVVYWNRSMATVWAYGKKATGSIQAIAPSGSAPTSVTVAGRTYAIESSAAAYDLSDLGPYHVGSSVTLLLGRTGGVAAVADIGASAGEKIGIVTDVAKTGYADGSGGTYTSQSVTILASDGETYQYQTRGSCRVGSLVRATVTGQGSEVTVRGVVSASLSGKVNAEGTMLGQYRFAPGVEILDVSDRRGVVLTPSRLAGMTLTSKAVRYYSLNPQGEIEILILNDATGDAYQYGILLRVDSEGEGTSKVYSYTYDVGGVTYRLPGVSTRFMVSSGPVRILGDPANPTQIRSLTATKAGEIVGNQFVADSQKYTLPENVVVYEYQGGEYLLSSLARAEESGKPLTAWYDKTESNGGCVRVILAK